MATLARKEKVMIILAANGLSKEGGTRYGTPSLQEKIVRNQYVLHIGLAECGLPERQQHLSRASKVFFSENGIKYYAIDRDTDVQGLPSVGEFDALHISGGYPGLLMYWMDTLKLWKKIVDPMILSQKSIYACSAGAIVLGKGLLFPTNLFAPTRPAIILPKKYSLGLIRGKGYFKAAVIPHNGRDSVLARVWVLNWLARGLSMRSQIIWIKDDEIIQI